MNTPIKKGEQSPKQNNTDAERKQVLIKKHLHELHKMQHCCPVCPQCRRMLIDESMLFAEGYAQVTNQRN